jgi:DNA-binding GntR family transcriptional regulator
MRVTAESASTGVERCLIQIRQMILNGQLLPGQKLHQADLAAQLNVSRIPVREALSTLQAEGVLHHRANTGFVVARFSGEDLAELYLMRRLLETELMRTADLTTVDPVELEKIDRQLATIPPAERPDEYQETNRRFHFAILESSPLALVRQEVERLWYKSSFYRSLYLSEANVSLHVHEDHLEIIKAVRANDLEALIYASDAHRDATEDLIIRRLGRSRPR